MTAYQDTINSALKHLGGWIKNKLDLKKIQSNLWNIIIIFFGPKFQDENYFLGLPPEAQSTKTKNQFHLIEFKIRLRLPRE
jgi:hypothetical protein